MSVLEMGHQGVSLALHAVAPGPQAGNIRPLQPQGTVLGNCVALHLFRRLERFHTARPLAQERPAGVNFHWLLLRRWLLRW